METVKKRIGFAREMARKIIDEYFAKNPPLILPIPVFEIATNFGFEIYDLNTLGNEQRALKFEVPGENRKLIGLNSSYPLVNKRFSVGHELGHFFLGHPNEKDLDDDEIKVCDQEADEFSAELLMPSSLFKEKVLEFHNVKELAKIFLVSEQALFIKLENQKLLKYL
jgi:Zn-dependent peptidase ImmA (M78 family)